MGRYFDLEESSHLQPPSREIVDTEVAERFADTGRMAIAQTANPVTATFRLISKTVAFCCAGKSLGNALVRPFAPLVHPALGGPESLSISVWDTADCGFARPLPWDDGEYGPYNRMVSSTDGRFVLDHGPTTALLLDRAERTLVGSFASAEHLSFFERAKPFSRLISIWCRDRGAMVIHAALVGCEGRGALLVGPGGSGKSTTSALGLLHGLEFTGDDYVSLVEGDSGFCGHMLYGSCLVDLDRFPAIGQLDGTDTIRGSGGAGVEKNLLLLDGHPLLREKMRISAIILPHLSDKTEATWEPESSARAMLSLAPTTIALQAGVDHSHFECLGRLVENVPAFRLHLSRNLKSIAVSIREILSCGS